MYLDVNKGQKVLMVWSRGSMSMPEAWGISFAAIIYL